MNEPASSTSTMGSVETPDEIAALEKQKMGSSGGTTDAMLGTYGTPLPLESASPNDYSHLYPSEADNASYLMPLQQTTQGYSQGLDSWRRAVVDAAKAAVGVPYVWGGDNLKTGVDCSGLVQQAYASAGIQLPRVSYQQATLGQRVGQDGLQPGDLVAWDNNPRQPGADHIAIYLGNGLIAEAPRPGLAVRIRKLGPGLEGGWGVHLDYGSPNTGTPPVGKSPVFSQQALYSLALSQGMTPRNALIASAIGMAESGGRTHATNTTGNSAGTDRGLWQINSYYHPNVSDNQAFDPLGNARAMYQISNGGTNWNAWSTFNNGAYQKFMNFRPR